MVLAYHLILTTYGFWLPNDPRGSWSNFVRSFDLYLAAGPATKVSTHRSIANKPHNHQARIAAKQSLHYNPVIFTNEQIQSVATGFHSAVTRSHITIHACSILPTHAHFVIARHKHPIETLQNQLKGQASTALTRANLHPFQHTLLPNGTRHTPWTEEGWDVYLNSEEDITRAINYVNQNPIKAHRPKQHWPFITPFTP